MKPYAFGIDIGGTTVKIGLFSTDGTFIESWEIPTRKEGEGAMILPDIARAIMKKLKEKGYAADDVEGVGVGVPGPVFEDGVVNGCVNLGWGVLDVRGQLSSLLGGMRVEVANDANVAALGEQWRGGGKGFKNVIMVTLGTGVGGGVIVEGKIVAGAHGAAGEIGHMTVNHHETIPCNCGKKGCLEQYASATGIVRKAKELLAASGKASCLRSVEDLTSKDVFDGAKIGDEICLQIVDFVGYTLGTALTYITSVTDPDVVVIGGGVSKAGQILLDAVDHHYREEAFKPAKNTAFKLAVLGNDAGMVGAVRMVISN